MNIIHDRTEAASLYPCDRYDCTDRATLVYQRPNHAAIRGACDGHRKAIEAPRATLDPADHKHHEWHDAEALTRDALRAMRLR